MEWVGSTLERGCSKCKGPVAARLKVQKKVITHSEGERAASDQGHEAGRDEIALVLFNVTFAKMEAYFISSL